MSNKIVFVNGKSKCGCVMAFSDGGGEYSDVHTIIPCAEHSMPESALTQRDDMQQTREQLAAAERRIAELDQRLIEYAGIATRVAELEARKVNLPAACADDEYFIDGVFQALRYERDVERAIRAAGIKVKES
ncbi:hypothetical protein ACU01Y_001514 [Salmonella enterica subsp. enterica serovar Newport]